MPRRVGLAVPNKRALEALGEGLLLLGRAETSELATPTATSKFYLAERCRIVSWNCPTWHMFLCLSTEEEYCA
jgi:hypothetical protein